VSSGQQLSVGQTFVQHTGQGWLTGEVTDVGAGSVTVSRSDGSTHTWDALPRSARTADRGSVVYRVVADLEGVRREFEEDPLAVVRQYLRESGDRMLWKSVREWFTTMLGLSSDDAAWKRLEKAMRADPHLDQQSGSWFWTAEPKQPREPKEGKSKASEAKQPAVLDLLERWTDKKLAQEERPKLADRIKALAASERADPTEQEVARAFQILSGDVDWARLSSSVPLRAAVTRRLIERASRDGATGFIVKVALDPSAKRLAEDAVEALRKSPPGDVERELLNLVSELRTRISEDASSNAEYLIGRLPMLTDALPDFVSDRLRLEVLRLVSVIGRRLGGRGEATNAASGALNRVFQGATPDAVARSFAPPMTVHEVLGVLTVVADGSLDQATVRHRLLQSLALADPSYRDLLEQPDTWSGLRLTELRHLLTDDALGKLLRSGPLRSSVVGKVVSSAASRMDAAALLRALADAPQIAPWVTPEHIATAVERDPQAPTAELLSRFARAQADHLCQAASDDHDRSMESAIAERDAARSEIASLRSELDDAHRSLQQLTSRLKQVNHEQEAARDAEIRQGSIDTLRVLADLLEEVRVAIPLALGAEKVLDSTYRDSLRRSTRVGLEVPHRVGEEIPFDPGTYRSITGDPSPIVVVVAPAYVLRSGDLVTPLRYGQVRPKNT
jgi:hypothetical protein